jgi:hypothetical protein
MRMHILLNVLLAVVRMFVLRVDKKTMKRCERVISDVCECVGEHSKKAKEQLLFLLYIE